VNATDWIVLSIVALLPGVWGLRGLLETISPPELRLTATGFTVRRALAPSLTVNWKDVDHLSVLRTYGGYRDRLAYRLHDGGKGSFELWGEKRHEVLELMNQYRGRATSDLTPTSSAFGHRPA
jgi:hypothetical protein